MKTSNSVLIIVLTAILFSISSCAPESISEDNNLIENTQATGEETEHVDESEKG